MPHRIFEQSEDMASDGQRERVQGEGQNWRWAERKRGGYNLVAVLKGST